MSRLNEVVLETRVYNIKEVRHTAAGQAVCNASTNVAGKYDDEWHPVWYDLTAWGDAAIELSKCQHGDDIIIREGRLTANAFRNRDGELVVKPAISADVIERVGSMEPAGSFSPPAPTGDDVPF